MEHLQDVPGPGGWAHDATEEAIAVATPSSIAMVHATGDRLFKFFMDLKQQKAADKEKVVQQHWREIAIHKDLLKLNPDWDRYLKLVQDNKLVVVLAHDGDAMVGYAVFIVSQHLHYKNVLVANDDVYFVDPKYRKTGLGSELIKYGESVLKTLGVQFVMLRTKHHSAHVDFLGHLGYAPMDIIYCKVL